jgi:hypothetical protein
LLSLPVRTTADQVPEERRDRELQAQRAIFEEEYHQLKKYEPSMCTGL